MTAFELCGKYNDQIFRLKRGRVEWDCIYYSDKLDKCIVSRLVEHDNKLFVRLSYIDPDTEVQIIQERN